jgi:hypothetical protein
MDNKISAVRIRVANTSSKEIIFVLFEFTLICENSTISKEDFS